jgi:hypothetical protein
MVKGGELRAQKRCDSKLLLKALQSRCDPERRKLMKIELVVATSAHSINGKHGRPGRED